MHNFKIVGGDTDSIMFCKPDMNPFTKEEQDNLIKEINDLLPKMINFKNDGIFPRVVYLKAKNYVMVDSKGKRKIKGSALKSATLEPIYKQFLNEMVDLLIDDKQDLLIPTYTKYGQMIENITDITPWCKKQTLSKTTYDSPRKNESNVIDAIKGKEYVPGDKIYLITTVKMEPSGEFYKVGPNKGQPKMKKVKTLVLKEDFTGDYDKDTYYDKLYKCVQRFETILPIKEMFKKIS